MKQLKLEAVIVEEVRPPLGDTPQGSCECDWGKKLDLTLINDKFCVGCGRIL